MPTHYKGTPREILALNTFIKFTRAAESLQARLQQSGSHGDLTPSQFGVLETLFHLGPMCQNEVGAKILKSSGNITLVIDNLEKRGLVHRQRHPEDRRMVLVHLTDAGREHIAKIFPQVLAHIIGEMSVLDPAEQETLGRLSRKLGLKDRQEKVSGG